MISHISFFTDSRVILSKITSSVFSSLYIEIILGFFEVWIFLAINLIWVIFCIFLFIKVIPPPSNADTSNKNPSPEYIEMLKDIRDQRPQ